jgi:hypothetical protein
MTQGYLELLEAVDELEEEWPTVWRDSYEVCCACHCIQEAVRWLRKEHELK